jgi:hypothetical protein
MNTSNRDLSAKSQAGQRPKKQASIYSPIGSYLSLMKELVWSRVCRAAASASEGLVYLLLLLREIKSGTNNIAYCQTHRQKKISSSWVGKRIICLPMYDIMDGEKLARTGSL